MMSNRNLIFEQSLKYQFGQQLNNRFYHHYFLPQKKNMYCVNHLIQKKNAIYDETRFLKYGGHRFNDGQREGDTGNGGSEDCNDQLLDPIDLGDQHHKQGQKREIDIQ